MIAEWPKCSDLTSNLVSLGANYFQGDITNYEDIIEAIVDHASEHPPSRDDTLEKLANKISEGEFNVEFDDGHLLQFALKLCCVGEVSHQSETSPQHGQ